MSVDYGTPIPLPCPKCYGKMVAVRYDAVLKVLKDRGWHICKECDFQRNTDEFKEALFTI